MTNELQKAASAIKAVGAAKAWREANILADYYLSAPDELAEAREIIWAFEEDVGVEEYDAPMRERAREFLKRTERT